MTKLVARLYRGPAAGKRLNMKTDTAAINIPTLKREKGMLGYSMVAHRYVRTNHTHPDGSVYFEWDKPKGTKYK
jgi:hypothetical protein